jgi:sRNA-binding regulator protein Hfq
MEVVLYLVNNGVPLKGILLEFDDETVVLSPHTTVLRKTIVAFYQAKDAPPKKTTRPPVR